MSLMETYKQLPNEPLNEQAEIFMMNPNFRHNDKYLYVQQVEGIYPDINQWNEMDPNIKASMDQHWNDIAAYTRNEYLDPTILRAISLAETKAYASYGMYKGEGGDLYWIGGISR